LCHFMNFTLKFKNSWKTYCKRLFKSKNKKLVPFKLNKYFYQFQANKASHASLVSFIFYFKSLVFCCLLVFREKNVHVWFHIWRNLFLILPIFFHFFFILKKSLLCNKQHNMCIPYKNELRKIFIMCLKRRNNSGSNFITLKEEWERCDTWKEEKELQNEFFTFAVFFSYCVNS
jgi:hypothetical protein